MALLETPGVLHRDPAARNGAGLRLVDKWLAFSCAALLVVAFTAHPRPAPIAAVLVLTAGLIFALAIAAERWPLAAIDRDFFPLPAVIVLFSVCGPLVTFATSARWDGALAAADLRIFGTLPAAWRSALGRPSWLTDAASIAYCSYYLIPVAMAIALRARGRLADFDGLVFGLVGTLLLSYAGYFLFPATGPRVPDAAAQAVLGGGALSRAVRHFLASAEINLLDAFPSGHTAVSLVFLGYGWRFFPRWRAPLLAAVAGIIFATVYLSLHYVVDLVAGTALALAAPALLARLSQVSRLFRLLRYASAPPPSPR